MRNLSIQAKVFGVIFTLVAAIVVVLATYFPARQMASAQAGMEGKARTYGRLLSRELEPAIAFSDRETAREVFDATFQDPDVTGLAVYDAVGRPLHVRGDLSSGPTSMPRGAELSRSAATIRVVTPIVSKEGPRGLVVVELGTSVLAADQSRIRATAVAIGGAAIVIGFAAAFLFSRSLAARLRAIARATERVAGGELDEAPILDRSRDEIGQLSKSFAAMFHDIRRLVAQISRSAAEEKERLDRLVVERTAQLDERNDDMRLVLDHVDQALLTVDLAGTVSRERSKAADLWLGAPDGPIWAWLGKADTSVGAFLELGWQALVDQCLPLAVVLDQLPKRLVVGGRDMRLSYTPILDDAGALARVLLLAKDVTAEVARERLEAEQRETLLVLERTARDRAGFVEFWREASDLVAQVADVTAPASTTLKRSIHTLKGSAAMMGLSALSCRCHDIEDSLAIDDATRSTRQRLELHEYWTSLATRFEVLTTAETASFIEASEAEHERFLRDLVSGAPRAKLALEVESWRFEPASRRLERLAKQAREMAARMGKDVVVSVVDDGVRLDARRIAPLWASLTHVVRNALDHGIEAAAERTAEGKVAPAQITLSARASAREIVLTIADDGRGVDWGAVAARARAAGLPSSSRDDLVEALFADGLSTAEATSQISGRGIGLGAARATCRAIGGTVRVHSARGVGTAIELSIPHPSAGRRPGDVGGPSTEGLAANA